MADEERDGPSLELPSFGFGRKRRKKEAQPDPEAVGEAPPPSEPEPEPEPAPEPAPEPVPTASYAPEPTAPPLFADEAPRTPAAPAPVSPIVAGPIAAGPAEVTTEEPRKKARKPRRERALPGLGGMAATVVTGVLVGVITVGLTFASLRLCEVVRGTSSCGGPGFLLLLAIVASMVVLGALLLRAWGVPDPGSTSFLAVGLLAVVALLFLVDVLFAWWMILVIPACSVLTFAVAHWVTTSVSESAD